MAAPLTRRRSRAGSNVRSPDRAAAQGRGPFEQVRQVELGALGRDLVAAAVLRGDFLLRSGARSSYYIDKYLFTTRPDLLRRLATELARRVPEGVQRIAGPAIGAIPLVTALSLETGLPMVIVRPEKPKEYGTAKQIEGSLEAGERVAFLAIGGGPELESLRVKVAGWGLPPDRFVFAGPQPHERVCQTFCGT